MSNLAFEAMKFARHVHRDQVRNYTGQPYADHLAEVAGIVAVTIQAGDWFAPNVFAVAWLHDCVEDQGVSVMDLAQRFGVNVAAGVEWLSDLEQGNRAERKGASRLRLAAAPGWVQTIKVADLISNTSSIVKHDPKFAVVYLEEKRLLLDVLTDADPGLLAMAREQLAVAVMTLRPNWKQLPDADVGDGAVRFEPAACMLPPEGWACTRNAGHDGPCAAIPAAV